MAAFVVLCVLAVAVAVGYAVRAKDREARAVRRGPPVAVEHRATAVEVAAEPHLAFRSTAPGATYGLLALVPLDRPGGPRAVTGLRCEVAAARSGRGICLWADRGVVTTYGATIFDERFRAVRSLHLSGIPSRTRVSPDGRYGAITVFVSGHSYAVAGFSTATTLVDLRTGERLANLEELEVLKDGERFTSPDFNFWGVTFAAGDDRFYATLGTGGKTYLVQGEVSTRQARVLRDNVECPSLSPDGTRIVFKKRVTSGLAPVRWRLTALDLATMAETELGDDRNVDDQVEWLDDGHVVYAVPRTSPSAVTDTWSLAVDGSSPPSLLTSGAATPVVGR